MTNKTGTEWIRENFRDIMDMQYNHGPVACISYLSNIGCRGVPTYRIDVKGVDRGMFTVESGWKIESNKDNVHVSRHVRDKEILSFMCGFLKQMKIPVYGWSR